MCLKYTMKIKVPILEEERKIYCKLIKYASTVLLLFINL